LEDRSLKTCLVLWVYYKKILTNNNTWYIIPYIGIAKINIPMKAKLLFHRKNIEPNGDITEMKIWQVQDSKDKPHGLKYSLVYIQNGKRVIGFDNAEGKGDHKHYKGKEYKYDFKSINNLINDFYGMIEKIRRDEI